MRSKNFSTPLWYRLSALGLGVLLLFWLPVEDLDVLWVILLAAALSALGAIRFFVASHAAAIERPETGRVRPGNDRPFWVYPLAGALTGMGSPLAAVLLMVFKSGLHGHPSPDFTPAQLMGVLSGIPFWIIGGALLGAGAGIYLKVR